MPPELGAVLLSFFGQLPFVGVVIWIIRDQQARHDKREADKEAQIAAERQRADEISERERVRAEEREKRRDEEYEKRANERQSQYTEALADLARRFSQSMAERDTSHRDGMVRIAEEVKTNTGQLTTLTAMMQAHDNRMDKVADVTVEKVLDRLQEKG